MTTKIRTTLFTGLFVFAMLTGLQAQEKYEYAIVNYGWNGKPYVTVSINGKTYKEISFGNKDIEGLAWFMNMNPPLIQVNELQTQGWDLYNYSGSASGTGGNYTFLLRKKSN